MREPSRELARLRLAVINPRQHDIFKGHFFGPGYTGIVPARVQQFGNRMPSVDGHELISQHVIRRMERYGQSHIRQLRQTPDLGHQARGAYGDSPPGQAEAKIIEL